MHLIWVMPEVQLQAIRDAIWYLAVVWALLGFWFWMGFYLVVEFFVHYPHWRASKPEAPDVPEREPGPRGPGGEDKKLPPSLAA